MIDADKQLEELRNALSNLNLSQDEPKSEIDTWLDGGNIWDSISGLTSAQLPALTLQTAQIGALTSAQITTISPLPNTAISVTVGGGGSGGSGGYNATSNSYIYNGSWAPTTANKIDLSGDSADIVINGRSLTGVISALEERLAILVPNENLEQEWEELKELGDRYRALEKNIKAQVETYNTLKSMPKPDPTF